MKNTINERLKSSGLDNIATKINNNERLSLQDGITLFKSEDILSIGFLANIQRERINGNKTFYILNQHINPTNVCLNDCKFCAFSRQKGQEGSYEMSLETVLDKVRSKIDDHISEIHIVGGLHPDIPYEYYLEMLSEIRKIRPEVHIQAFTAVEIAYLADLAGKNIDATIDELVEAGLGSLPGGGAEVFSSRVRKELCETKLSPQGWLAVHKIAHNKGLRSNATMLFGHIETIEERVEHMIDLRKVQDETGGFLSFIPLAFHPENTAIADVPGPSGFDSLKTLAISRLMLDNFNHIKAFWIMLGTKLAQLSLSFGVDDIDGTVIEEKITHMAGARTAEELTREELVSLIEEAGRTPIERGTLYNEIGA